MCKRVKGKGGKELVVERERVRFAERERERKEKQIYEREERKHKEREKRGGVERERKKRNRGIEQERVAWDWILFGVSSSLRCRLRLTTPSSIVLQNTP